VKWPRKASGDWSRPTWWFTKTRSPSRKRVTPGPTATTIPAGSWPMTLGARGAWYHSIASPLQRPQAMVFTRSSPGPISGTGRSSMRMSLFR